MSAANVNDPVVVGIPAPDVHPIGTRVRVKALDDYGTVRAWAIFRDCAIYRVAMDSGLQFAIFGDQVERARPRPDWRPTVLIGRENRP